MPLETVIVRPADKPVRCVAVTGASGFVGTTLVAALADRGWQVRALTRSRDAGRRLEHSGVQTILGSLSQPEALTELVAGADAVVHCAGAVRGAVYHDFTGVNVVGTENLLAAMGDRPLPLVALSSLAAREPELSDYACSKRAMETVLANARVSTATLVLRPPAVYGPGDRELKPLFDAFARGIAPLPGALDARVSLLYVDDLAAAIVAWLAAYERVSGVYEIGDGEPGGYSWEQVVATAERLLQRRIRRLRLPKTALAGFARINRRMGQWTGYAPMLTPGKLAELRHADWVCDNAPLQRVLDWAPRTGLDSGLQQACGWGAAVPPAN